LHWHVIPRFRRDPHFPNPIWGAQLREPGVMLADATALQQALAELLSRL
jgi:diadenosine tetraphosphate (Ap4A) HIT family hydrolase